MSDISDDDFHSFHNQENGVEEESFEDEEDAFSREKINSLKNALWSRIIFAGPGSDHGTRAF